MQNQTPPATSSPSDSTQVEKRIDLLFAKFAVFYGNVWRSQFKDEVFMRFAKKEWQEALKSFSDKVITEAILTCRDFYEFPPSLGQILQACKDIKKKQVTPVKPESYVPANKELVASCLQRCRELLSL